MNRPHPFTWLQISPPVASPSRLRALRAQKRDKRLARNALISLAYAEDPR